MIQLRDKEATSSDLYEASAEAVEQTRGHNVLLIINDRVDIAFATGADGVHLGQDDMPADKARQIMGNEAIIGLSTHSIKQAKAALRLPINYIAIGPIFHSHTKKQNEPVVGLDGLRRVREVTGTIPLVAIGGINADNVSSVFSSGADSVAMISALVGNPYLCSRI